jgi:ATP-dependent Lon protease
MNDLARSKELPLLLLRRMVVFPQQTTQLFVARSRSLAAMEAALATEDKVLVVAAQLDENVEVPNPQDVHAVGTRVVVRSMHRTRRTVCVEVLGLDRVRIESVIGPAMPPVMDEDEAVRNEDRLDQDRLDEELTGEEEAGEDGDQRGARNEDDEAEDDDDCDELTRCFEMIGDVEPATLRARVATLEPPDDRLEETDWVIRDVVDRARRLLERRSPHQLIAFDALVERRQSPIQLTYALCPLLSMPWQMEQRVLEAESLAVALTSLGEHLRELWHEVEVRDRVMSKVAVGSSSADASEGGRAGKLSVEQQDYQDLRSRLDSLSLPTEVRKEVDRGLLRLSRLTASSSEYESTRAHLELVADLPWRRYTVDNIDLVQAERLLDRDHHGLRQVKERILEQLAVMKLRGTDRAPILCFVGPPGVGKTSLGKSIAEAIGRKFARESLGGMSDEAELRGHRRTYIGAMPGRIVQAIQRAESMNPVLLLDEVDKLGRDFHGDPSAALLEILDPAQNHTFRDNYLMMPFDLSRVMFIATANTLDTIPRPLLDRMEILDVSGYSDEEKQQIARSYLLPRQVVETGLSAGQLRVTDEALRRLVAAYTRESGVRELTRVISTVCRKVATQYARGRTQSTVVDVHDLDGLLGPPRYSTQESMRQQLGPGVVAGLARSVVGGEVLYVEAVLLPEAQDLTLTGQLGEVMKESARTAQNCVRSKWAELNLEKQALACGVHIHVPAGATPKDGPSTGIAVATALASLYSHQPARRDTAMTGEITLTGLVLAVGGIKEKVLAAHRAGIKQIILPRANECDLDEIPAAVRASLQFTLVDRVEQAIAAAIPAFARRLRYLLDEPDDE